MSKVTSVFRMDIGEVKGAAAEVAIFGPRGCCWVVGEYPPNCHESVALSCCEKKLHVLITRTAVNASWLYFFL